MSVWTSPNGVEHTLDDRGRCMTCGRQHLVCRHEESLYGRCVRCGMTWERQAVERRDMSATPAPRMWTGITPRCLECGEIRTDADSRMCEQCKKEGRA